MRVLQRGGRLFGETKVRMDELGNGIWDTDRIDVNQFLWEDWEGST
jgi:hypothetical protein